MGTYTSTDVIRGGADISIAGSDMGFIEGDITFTYMCTITPWRPAQKTSDAKAFLDYESCEITIPFAEYNLTKYQYLLAAGTYVLDSGGVKKKITVGGSSIATADYKELIVTPVNKASDNELITIYKTLPISNLEQVLSPTANRGASITFKGFIDTSKSAGNELFCIGDTTASA